MNWNKFLNKKEITPLEWSKADDLAGDWVTCACGNLCKKIPRSDTGYPMDRKLYDLGCDFYGSIGLRDKQDAKLILKAIEKRSSEILSKL